MAKSGWRRGLLQKSALIVALGLGLGTTGAAQAQAQAYSIAAEPLSQALRDYARQSGRQIIFSDDLARGRTSPALHGSFTADEALARLLAGTGLTVRTSPSGALMILRTASETPADRSAAHTESSAVSEVVVTGSHIPRARVEGPAPVTVVTANDIQREGLATTSDIMASLTQNLGEVDNNQNTNGFSPGAQAVDLRGLGPNHTLVLVNGRRIADYPQSYQGNSNFTDISNIPSGLIDRVEILTGTASAVYGSDAISGVVNFIMKQRADGTTVDFRVGETQHGGGASQRLQITSGWSNDRFDSVFGLELLHETPLWGYQRSFADSRLDSPAPLSRISASPVFTRIDADGNYIDPGKATCDALAAYDKHSIIYAYRRNYGYYCGSYQDVGYGTLENGREAVNFYGSARYHLTSTIDAFLDVQAGLSDQASYNTPLQWENSYQLNGDSSPIPFFNQATGQVEQWQRKYFTIEENGGFSAGEIRNRNDTISVNTGLKGAFPGTNWNFEALLGYSYNHLIAKEPALVSDLAQSLYLGPSLGVDPASGLNIYNAPISRLYTPLTVAQFRSITRLSVDDDSSSTSNASLTVNNTHLFDLPAGPAGFAAVAEFGHQYYGLKPDPASLDGTYFGLHNTGAVGSRNHFGLGAELSAPLLPMLTATTAGRYDHYSYSSNGSGKFTYSAGLEFRPVRSLLLRASYGTGFRAPDLSYLYAGASGSSSSGTDYYQCRKYEPSSGPDYYDNCSNGDVNFDGRSHGSINLKDETSRSFTGGVVFSPWTTLDITADYYNIRLDNEVEYQSSDTILREEADCRLGQTLAGQPVDPNSATCQQVTSQVVRNPANSPYNPLGITSVLVLPINAATDHTSGIDVNIRYRLNTPRAGLFDVRVGYTRVLTHDIQLFPDQPVINELTDLYDYVIPRNKWNYSVGWTMGRFNATLHGQTLGGLPDFNGTHHLHPTSIFNGSISYDVTDRMTLNVFVDNLLDTKPGNGDQTWTTYPYYASSWFSPIGRAFFVEMKYRIGGHAGR